MKNKFLKIFNIAVCALLLFGTVACGDPQEDIDPDENVVVRENLEQAVVKILLGVESMPSDYQNVVAEINRRLAREGKPYTVKFDFTLINGYMVDLESKAKNGYDGAWGYIDFMPSLIEKGIIKTNLMPYLEEWGPKILENASDYTFKQVTDYKTGNVYAVPALVPTANGTEIQLLRKDWMEKVGMSEVKTLNDFDTYLSRVNADKDIAYTLNSDGEYEKKAGFYALVPDYYNSFLLREYCPTYYFPIVQDGRRPVYIDIDAENGQYEVKSFYQSQAFIDLVQKARSYLDAGYVNPSQNQNGENLFNKGYAASISDYAVLKMSERINKFKAAVPNGELYDFLIESENNPKIVYSTVGDSIVALRNSSHTEELIDFLNWTKNQENHDLLCYGLLGENYYLTEDGRLTFTDPSGSGKVIPSNKRYSDYMPYWAMQDIKYLRFSEHLPQSYIDNVKNWETDENGETNVRISPLIGFTLQNTDALIVAKAKVSAVDEVANSLTRGLEKYDRVIDAASGKTVYQRLVEDLIADNAMQDLIDEVQRQLDEFLAAKQQ